MTSRNVQKECQKPIHSTSISLPKKVRHLLWQTTKKIGASTVALLLLASCGNRETLLTEINNFNKSVQVGSESIAAYYSSINRTRVTILLANS